MQWVYFESEEMAAELFGVSINARIKLGEVD